MIVSRAPLRISFVGGGTDLPDYYKKSPGRVISTTIDKYVHVAINRTPLIDSVSARYSITETVSNPSELRHTRIKAALVDLGIDRCIEIGTFASLPAKTGLGSSSSFSVALLKGLNAYLGKTMDKAELAEAASRLEIDLVGEPIGKQDQYAASFGGFNVFQFNADGSVDVEPVLLDYKKRFSLEKQLALFYTGITRNASSVLSEQKINIESFQSTMAAMAASVIEFKTRLLNGDFQGLGTMLHEGWIAKKSLASGVSNSVLDELYAAGVDAGAWGGKVLGAGGGGCILFLVRPDKRARLSEAVSRVALAKNLEGFREIPIRLGQAGADILYRDGAF